MAKYVTIETEIYLGDFDDSDLAEELESRGYLVSPNLGLTDIENVAWHVRNGNLKEALIYLERNCPELRGIVDLLNK